MGTENHHYNASTLSDAGYWLQGAGPNSEVVENLSPNSHFSNVDDHTYVDVAPNNSTPNASHKHLHPHLVPGSHYDERPWFFDNYAPLQDFERIYRETYEEYYRAAWGTIEECCKTGQGLQDMSESTTGVEQKNILNIFDSLKN